MVPFVRPPLRAASRLTPAFRCRSLHASPTSTLRPFPSRLAFAFDIDGVLKQGPNVLPQAKRTLAYLSGENEWGKGIPWLLMTNGGGVVDEKRRGLLGRDFGQVVGVNQLVQSHTPLRAMPLVQSLADSPVLILGGAGNACREVAESYGLQKAYIAQDVIAWKQSVWPKTKLVAGDEAYVKRGVDFDRVAFEAIIVMHDSHDWGRDITLITELIQSQNGILGARKTSLNPDGQIPIIFSNPDMLWKSDYPLPRYGQGAFRLATESIYRAVTGKALRAIQLGKPHKATYEFAQGMLEDRARKLRKPSTPSGSGPEADGPLKVYMIGDNPESDIAGANAHGWSSVLVKTGVYEGAELGEGFEPTGIKEDVEGAVEWAVEREVERELRAGGKNSR